MGLSLGTGCDPIVAVSYLPAILIHKYGLKTCLSVVSSILSPDHLSLKKSMEDYCSESVSLEGHTFITCSVTAEIKT